MSMVYYVGDVISHNLRTDKYRICKLGGRVVRVTCHELPLVKVKRSKVKVTVSRNVSGATTLQFGSGWSLSHQIQTYHHEGNVQNCRSNKPEVEMWRTFSIGPTRCKWSTENVPKSLKKNWHSRLSRPMSTSLLGPTSPYQTVSQSVLPFLQGSRSWPTVKQNDLVAALRLCK